MDTELDLSSLEHALATLRRGLVRLVVLTAANADD